MHPHVCDVEARRRAAVLAATLCRRPRPLSLRTGRPRSLQRREAARSGSLIPTEPLHGGAATDAAPGGEHRAPAPAPPVASTPTDDDHPEAGSEPSRREACEARRAHAGRRWHPPQTTGEERASPARRPEEPRIAQAAPELPRPRPWPARRPAPVAAPRSPRTAHAETGHPRTEWRDGPAAPPSAPLSDPAPGPAAPKPADAALEQGRTPLLETSHDPPSPARTGRR